MIAFAEQATSQAGLNEIERGALEIRRRNDELKALANELEERITAAKRELMPKIRAGLNKLVAAVEAEKQLVIAGQPLFDDPKTRVFHGIKVGWPKGRGGIEIPDSQRTIARARDLLTKAQFMLVVKTTEEIRKKALGSLPVDVLKKLGVEIKAAGEYPLVSISEGDVTELVEALLKDATEALEGQS